MGHDPRADGCTGDVLILRNCEDVSISNCVLFGCGLNGLVARDCANVTFSDSNIIGLLSLHHEPDQLQGF
jgi:hypothetical protein